MKYTNLQAFEKHLEGASPNHFSPVYLILSKERFLLKKAVDLVIKALTRKNKTSFSLKSFDSDHLFYEAIQEELQTRSLFSDQKAVWVDLAEKTATSFLKELQGSFSQLAPGSCLVVSAASLSHATTFYKQAEKAGVILEILEEKSWEKEKTFVAWVTQSLTEIGKTIDGMAAQQLIKQIGTDPAILHQELSKLSCYVGDRVHITLEDVKAICIKVNGENSWQLGEAIFKRDVVSSLRISKALLDEETPFLALLRQIRNQFQTDFTICTLLANGGTPQEITQAFPYMKGFILDKHMRSAKEYGMARFKAGMEEIDAMEFMAKNGSTDSYFLAELLIIKLTTK